MTSSRGLWTYREVGRVVGRPELKDGLLYVGDLSGVVHCLDATNGCGRLDPRHESTHLGLPGPIVCWQYGWCHDRVMTVLRLGRRKEELARIEMGAPLYSRPALVGGTLYVATAESLYLIGRSPDGAGLPVSIAKIRSSQF